jgi:hypothetical protein
MGALLLALAAMVGADTNQFGWPIDIEANLALIDEIIQEAPNKLPQRAPSLGAFIVALSDDVAAATESAGPRRHLRGNTEMSWEEKTAANRERMATIEALLTEQQDSSGADFCSQVVSKFASSNMMLVLTSPKCTKWLAKRAEVELLEVDGEVHAYHDSTNGSDAVSSAGEAAVGVGASVAGGGFTTPASPATDISSASPSISASTSADADTDADPDPEKDASSDADADTDTDANADASTAASEPADNRGMRGDDEPHNKDGLYLRTAVLP